MYCRSTLAIFSLVFLSGCISISRNAGFDRIENENTFFSHFSSQRSKDSMQILSEEINLANKQSIRVKVYGVNRARKDYLIGLIVPIFPLFIFPYGKSGFSNEEKLRLNCAVSFDPGPQFFEAVEGRPNARRPTPAFYKNLEERRNKGGDICVDVSIEDVGKRIFRPKSELNLGSKSPLQEFTFDIEAVKVPTFKVKVPRVKLATGEIVDVNLEGELSSFDVIQIELSGLAP